MATLGETPLSTEFPTGGGSGGGGDVVELVNQSEAPDLPEPGDATIYVRSGRLVIAHNDDGTARYRWMDLTDTAALWKYAAVEPGDLDIDMMLALDFEEGSGTEFADSSLYSNHGAASGTVAWMSRPGGGSAVNTANGYVQVPFQTYWQMVGDVTLACWFRAISFWSDYWQNGLIAQNQGSGPNPKWMLCVKSGAIHFDLSTSMSEAYSFSTDTWYHLAATRIDSTVQFYVNGEPVGDPKTDSGSMTPNAALTIGYSEGNRFQGDIDGVRFYRRGLDASEIEALAAE